MVLGFAFLLLAWMASAWFLVVSVVLSAWACLRYIYIRKLSYSITPKIIKFSSGLFYRRTAQVELFRLKDYIIMQSFTARLFRFMHLTLKSNDAENAVIHLRAIPESDIVEVIRGYILTAREQDHIEEIN